MSTQPEAALQPWHAHRFAYFRGASDSNITTGEDYNTQALASLWSMEPGDKAKMAGLAMIPSSYADYDARKHEAQRERGSFIALTGDVDGGNHDAAAIQSAVEAFAPGSARLIYTSAHSRPGDQRWRIILPLETPVQFGTWYDAQIAFFRFMEAGGIAMDHALARAGQPVYLPNVPPMHKSGTPLRGEDGKPLYYQRHATPLDTPGLSLAAGNVADGIAAIRRQRLLDEQERERMRREAERQRASKPQGDGASLIDDFNASNSVTDMLAMCGYQQCPRNGDDWKSPQQTSESYATRVMGAKWFSLSATDAASGLGTSHPSGCWGDAFDLFCFWQHGNDRKAALRQLGRERRDSNVTYPAAFHAEPPSWMNDIPTYDEQPDWAADDGEPVFDVPESAHEPDPSDTFPLLSLSDLDALPPPSWLVDGLISDSGLSILYGDPGSGKSFVMIDMALRLALGWDWHGAQTKRVGVLYIAGEGVRGLGNRIKGWRMKHQVDPSVDIPFVLLPVAAQLLDAGERAKLIRTIDAAKIRIGFDVGMIVIDTVSRSIAGQDENGQETMSAFVKACDEVREHCGGAVVGVHHSGKDKDKGMRGSTVLLGACDATFKVQKADHLVTLKCEKQKDGEEAQPIYLKMERFAWEGPEKEQSTLIPIVTQAQSVAGNGLTMEQIRGAFSILTDAWCAKKPLSHKPQTKADGRFAPLILSKRLGGDVDVWVEHIAGWLENGCLSFEEFDKRSKKFGLQVLEPIN